MLIEFVLKACNTTKRMPFESRQTATVIASNKNINAKTPKVNTTICVFI